MVNPIYILATFLGIAFLLGFVNRLNKGVAFLLFYLSLIFTVVISFTWFVNLLNEPGGIEVFTAGFKPPYSINLYLGTIEALLIGLINLVGFLSAMYLSDKFRKGHINLMILYLTLLLGLNGLILTRDLFNIFVFMEIASISTYALLALDESKGSIAAGFKYMIAGGLSSVLYLLGTIFIYRFTGTLNLDGAVAAQHLIIGKAGSLALFMMSVGILIELKPFPANGWALDVYQTVDSGIVSIIAVGSSGAFLYIIYKFLPFFSALQLEIIAAIGLITFVASNFMGLKQTNARRLLGYSSIAQMGLLLASLTLMQLINPDSEGLKLIVVGGFFLNHFFAKAGLFWLAGLLKSDKLKDWAALKNNAPLLITFGVFIIALVGLPPFPGFWAKWHLITNLFYYNAGNWVVFILLGSILEAVYLLRWFGYAVKGKSDILPEFSLSKIIPISIFMLLLILTGLEQVRYISGMSFDFIYPLLAVAIMYVLDFLSVKIKTILSIGLIGYFAWISLPQMQGITQLFGVIFYGFSILFMIAFMARKNEQKGLMPLMMLLVLTLGNLLRSVSMLEFFYNWEIMTLSSYLLIMKGRNAEKSALTYILFSLGGAFLIMAGFGLAYSETASVLLASLTHMTYTKIPVFILLALGFLVKTGSLGLHLWLPGSYSEAEDDITPILSGILSKAGIFGLFILFILVGRPALGVIKLESILGWLGAITAFTGALMAIFQEDIKKLLAYSSMGQVGYIVLALAINSHLGWVAALYHTFNHLIFKGLLFLAVAGLIYRVKTRLMYQMGGLIRQMPITFIAVLMGIIAMSGVPPLTGFGGKWLLYSALIEKGWYLQAGLAFFASTVAFLYCFRLIHTMFLGQIKPHHRNIKEAPVWMLIPQFVLLALIMGLSMYPNLILKPIMAAVAGHFDSTVAWDGYTVISSLGYWNGNAVMMVSMGATTEKGFKTRDGKEIPDKPETTHYAQNFFAPYQKALGFLVNPIITRFWNMIAEWVHTIGALLRNIYSGDGQSYAFHIILFVLFYYLIWGVK